MQRHVKGMARSKCWVGEGEREGRAEKGKGESHDGNHFTPWQTISTRRKPLTGQQQRRHLMAEAPATAATRRRQSQQQHLEPFKVAVEEGRLHAGGEEFIMQLKIMKWHRAQGKRSKRRRRRRRRRRQWRQQQKSLAEDAAAQHSTHRHKKHTHTPSCAVRKCSKAVAAALGQSRRGRESEEVGVATAPCQIFNTWFCHLQHTWKLNVYTPCGS